MNNFLLDLFSDFNEIFSNVNSFDEIDFSDEVEKMVINDDIEFIDNVS